MIAPPGYPKIVSIPSASMDRHTKLAPLISGIRNPPIPPKLRPAGRSEGGLRLHLGLLGLRLAVPLLGGGLLGLLGSGRGLGLQPRHPRAQLLAHRLDGMVEVALEELRVHRPVGLVLEHPLAGELAR